MTTTRNGLDAWKNFFHATNWLEGGEGQRTRCTAGMSQLLAAFNFRHDVGGLQGAIEALRDGVLQLEQLDEQRLRDRLSAQLQVAHELLSATREYLWLHRLQPETVAGRLLKALGPDKTSHEWRALVATIGEPAETVIEELRKLEGLDFVAGTGRREGGFAARFCRTPRGDDMVRFWAEA